ncbi:hypothetical protein TSTA_044890 [Talaromyces stipitatus ATCC 10500]|uniref:Uncharacterized protein n=1 Tax=Talaromyces stipitatus (strain ATCC 10500 / CBS 375.48 / QM 6759 / NRRL 1006) TaxID=441959 RepID=B8MLB0_TALSN|nr:uncharacterized protein TSTA_044890 [Talaromyces stipitatus ATCC 10500]EED15025.1 hypothetical protein TSTA_044890 [Talaromyces stipitatus ATCC 10500]
MEHCHCTTIAVPHGDKYLAIARGAALCRLEGIRPKTRRSRRHYGFKQWIPFRKGINPEVDA